ncbi:MAG: hypothetical protein L6Q92_16235 [Phycisphaerae bacterium]|nr:hypothetical protein [Phycisphaerae bacterium]MCK6497970.1 hypothetical protein [Nitrospira sp.]
MNRWKEVAKFVCGFEAFHAISHASIWLSGTTLAVFGMTIPANWNALGTVLNGAIAILLGVYAWKPATAARA